MEKYRCSVCGYIHEGELSEDFKCPRCKKPASFLLKQRRKRKPGTHTPEQKPKRICWKPLQEKARQETSIHILPI